MLLQCELLTAQFWLLLVLLLLLLALSGSMPAAIYVAATLRVADLSSTGSWGAVMSAGPQHSRMCLRVSG